MKCRFQRALSSSFPLLFAALGCAGDSSPPGNQLALTVSPLSLPGITDACYGVAVYDGDPEVDGDLVWSQQNICSSQYGNGPGGGVTYIGPCSAQPDGRINVVELAIDNLYGAGVGPTGTPLAAQNWQNPCPASNPCSLEAACFQNADTQVEFNLVVMRSATQGFFDIAVNFEDIFCSAKLDCVDALLHRSDGGRGETAVLGFACTGGDEATHLYLDDVVITCDGQPVVTVDPTAGPGQLGPVGNGAYQVAIYRGLQALEGAERCYWNGAIGLDLAAFSGDCVLTARGTASDSLFAGGPGNWQSPASTVYPVINWNVPITVDGGRVCGANPLNGTGSGVQTGYTAFAGEGFDHHYACGETPSANRAPVTVGALGPVVVAEGGATSFSIASYFSDPDGDALTFSVVGPQWVGVLDDTFMIDTNAVNVFPFLLAGSYGVTLIADDGQGGQASLAFVIEVTNVNVPPFAEPFISGIEVFTRTDEQLDLSPYILETDGDSLTFVLTAGPSFVSVVGSTVMFTQPTLTDAGPFQATIAVSDGVNPPVFMQLEGTVTHINQGPTTGFPNPYTFNEISITREPFTFYYFMAGFWEDAEGDSFTIAYTDLPTWLYTGDPDTYEPDPDSFWLMGVAPAVGSYAFSGVATDEHGAVGQVRQIVINVVP